MGYWWDFLGLGSVVSTEPRLIRFSNGQQAWRSESRAEPGSETAGDGAACGGKVRLATTHRDSLALPARTRAFGTNASKAACKNTAARQVIDAVKKVVEHLNKSNVMKLRETNMYRLTFVRSNVNDNFNLQCCTEKPHSHVPTCFFISGVLVVSLLFRSPKATDAVCYRATYAVAVIGFNRFVCER
ncbi:unnamed protein product [Ascophyllum nodosum]